MLTPCPFPIAGGLRGSGRASRQEIPLPRGSGLGAGYARRCEAWRPPEWRGDDWLLRECWLRRNSFAYRRNACAFPEFGPPSGARGMTFDKSHDWANETMRGWRGGVAEQRTATRVAKVAPERCFCDETRRAIAARELVGFARVCRRGS